MFAYMDCNSREISLRLSYEQAIEILSSLYEGATKKELFRVLEISSRKNKKFHQDLLTYEKSCGTINT